MPESTLNDLEYKLTDVVLVLVRCELSRLRTTVPRPPSTLTEALLYVLVTELQVAVNAEAFGLLLSFRTSPKMFKM